MDDFAANPATALTIFEHYTFFLQPSCPHSFTALQTVIAGGQSFVAVNTVIMWLESMIPITAVTVTYMYSYPQAPISVFATLGPTVEVVNNLLPIPF